MPCALNAAIYVTSLLYIFTHRGYVLRNNRALTAPLTSDNETPSHVRRQNQHRDEC
jgi:hypothetical protein